MPARSKIRSVIVCDDVRQERSGKDICIGIYNGVIVVGGLPAIMRQLSFRIEFEIDTPGKRAIALELIDPARNKIIQADGEVEIENAKDPGSLTFSFGPVTFAIPGRYSINFTINSQKRTVARFTVRAAEQQPKAS
jgi:hypothetical protein